MGFKSSNAGRQGAFLAWRSLIDNFALDKGMFYLLILHIYSIVLSRIETSLKLMGKLF